MPIPFVTPDTLTPEQKPVYDRILGGRGIVAGPFLAVLHAPELAERWQALGEVLRYRTSLGPLLTELAVLVVARWWNSPVEWHIHVREARKAGLPEPVITAIAVAQAPKFEDRAQRLVYEYSRALLAGAKVEPALYDETFAALGTVGIVELTTLVGYFVMVAMTLAAHQIPLPPGGAVDLPEMPGLLTPLPPAV
jgi:4-carboxymuconolactone decarboxylase